MGKALYRSLDKNLKTGDYKVSEPVGNVFATRFTNKDMCRSIIKACNDHDNWGKRDNKKYPTYDVLLADVDPEFSKEYMMAINTYVRPMIIDKYNLDKDVDSKWYYESFVVKYTPEIQAGLDLHHDASIFTCLLTLNDEFKGGGTYFKNQDVTVIGNVGDMSVHPGRLTHYHSANDITDGERYVLVTFVNMQL